MTVIDYLRLAVVLVWAMVLIIFSFSVWRVLTGRSHGLDPVWSLLGAYGLMSIGYNARWYLPVNTIYFYSALHVFSIVLAVASLVFAHSFKRAHP